MVLVKRFLSAPNVIVRSTRLDPARLPSEPIELKDAAVHGAAMILPSAEGRAVAGWRLAVRVCQRTSGLEQVQRLELAFRRALTIGDGHLRTSRVFNGMSPVTRVPADFSSPSLPCQSLVSSEDGWVGMGARWPSKSCLPGPAVQRPR